MQLDTSGRVSTVLDGVRVFFDGTQAPMLYLNSSRIGAVVPVGVVNGVSIHIEYQSMKSNTERMNVASAAPGIFLQPFMPEVVNQKPGSGQGTGLIYSDNWMLVTKDNPARSGSVVTIIWTGGGPMTSAEVRPPPVNIPRAREIQIFERFTLLRLQELGAALRN